MPSPITQLLPQPAGRLKILKMKTTVPAFPSPRLLSGICTAVILN